MQKRKQSRKTNYIKNAHARAPPMITWNLFIIIIEQNYEATFMYILDIFRYVHFRYVLDIFRYVHFGYNW